MAGPLRAMALTFHVPRPSLTVHTWRRTRTVRVAFPRVRVTVTFLAMHRAFLTVLPRRACMR